MNGGCCLITGQTDKRSNSWNCSTQIVTPTSCDPCTTTLLRWKNYRKRSSAIHGVDTRHKNELTRHFGVYWWLLVVVLAATAAGTFSNRQDPITVESDKGKWELIWRVFVQMEFGYESDLLSEKWQKSLDKRGISGYFLHPVIVVQCVFQIRKYFSDLVMACCADKWIDWIQGITASGHQ